MLLFEWWWTNIVPADAILSSRIIGKNINNCRLAKKNGKDKSWAEKQWRFLFSRKTLTITTPTSYIWKETISPAFRLIFFLCRFLSSRQLCNTILYTCICSLACACALARRLNAVDFVFNRFQFHSTQAICMQCKIRKLLQKWQCVQKRHGRQIITKYVRQFKIRP